MTSTSRVIDANKSLVYQAVLETRPKCSDQDQHRDRNSTAKIRRLHRRIIVTNRLPNNRISKVTSNRDHLTSVTNSLKRY